MVILYSIINLLDFQRIKIEITGYTIVTGGKRFSAIDMDRPV